MSYPEIILAGTPGREYETHTADLRSGGLGRGRWLVGTQMIMGDGRKFRYALNGGATLVAGDVIQAAANVANHILQTPQAAAAVGAQAVSITLGATAVVQDEYTDGFLQTNLGTGFGYTYLVDRHAANAGGGTFSAPLAPGHTVQVAIPTTANSVSLVHHPYRAVIQVPVTTRTGAIVGIGVKPLTATTGCGWLQTRGMGVVTFAGTAILGDGAASVAASTAGSAAPATGIAGDLLVGIVQVVATTTNKTSVFIIIDG